MSAWVKTVVRVWTVGMPKVPAKRLATAASEKAICEPGADPAIAS